MKTYRVGIAIGGKISWNPCGLTLSEATKRASELSEIYRQKGLDWHPVIERVSGHNEDEFFVLALDKATGEVYGRWVQDFTEDMSIVDFYIESQPNEIYYAVYNHEVPENEAWSDFSDYINHRIAETRHTISAMRAPSIKYGETI